MYKDICYEINCISDKLEKYLNKINEFYPYDQNIFYLSRPINVCIEELKNINNKIEEHCLYIYGLIPE